jgi:hypothetical protein
MVIGIVRLSTLSLFLVMLRSHLNGIYHAIVQDAIQAFKSKLGLQTYHVPEEPFNIYPAVAERGAVLEAESQRTRPLM